MDQYLQQVHIEDPEAFQEFREALSDYAPQIENLLAELTQWPEDGDRIASLFRLFHNIKGDAAMCRVEFITLFVHAIENLLTRLRSGEIQFTPRLRDVLLLSLDRIELAVDMLSEDKSIAGMHLMALEQGLEGLSDISGAALDTACARLVDALAGFEPMPDTQSLVLTRSAHERSEDLVFFRGLALQLEQRQPLFQGRTARNLTLALEANQLAGSWVKPEQLEAAVYMHDVGMMFLAEPLWLKTGPMTPEGLRQLADHPRWSAGLLLRMPGWEDAAQIVLQHHEKPDGTGYPQGLRSHEICPGAKILALVDAFESVMLKHVHRGQQRSMLRAVAEVNASEKQFDAIWIEPFNQVVRKMLEQTPVDEPQVLVQEKAHQSQGAGDDGLKAEQAKRPRSR